MAELSNDSKLNISFKHLQGKSQTENAWGPEGEQVGIFFNIPSNVIFSEMIPYYPQDAILNGVAKKITANLIIDPASNGHAYFAVWRSGEAWYPPDAGPGDLVKNVIQPSYNDPFDTLGRNYNAIPYDTSNNFIPETDARAWVYQYQSGVFYQQETNGTTPDHIELYVYSGRFLSDELSGFTSGLSNLVLNDLNDVTINNFTLQNYNVLMYSGGSSGSTGGTWINFNIEDRYVNVEGDTMTGSLIISGAGYLILTHGASVNEISNDSGFTDASANALVTEEAIAAAFNNLEDLYVNITGDVMTGDLTITGGSYLFLTEGGHINDISEDSGLTDSSPFAVVTEEALSFRFDAIENNVYTKEESDDRFVNVTGDTMTGPLIINAQSGLTLQSGTLINELSDDVTLSDASPNAVVSEEVISQLMNGINDQYVHVTGDTMTGNLIMSHLSGETLRSTYFDTVGTIILGKDYSFSTILTGNTNVDSFSKTLDYSCIWEYSIKK